MATTSPDSPGRFSFGVELEFAIAFIHESQQEEVPLDAGDFDKTYRKLIVVPDEPDDGGDGDGGEIVIRHQDEHSFGVKAAYEHVQRTLDRLGLNGGPTCIFYPDKVDDFHMFSRWWVDSDDSIFLPGDLDIFQPYKGVCWIAAEVTSPALWSDDPRSLEEVRRVCSALQGEYWTLITPTCGLHFHIGRGIDWMATTDLRRIAALLFAADPLLAQLHPARRLASRYCMGIREFSRVAVGVTQAESRQRLDRQLPSWLPSTEVEPEPFAPAPAGTATALFEEDRVIPRGALSGYPPADPDHVSWERGADAYRDPAAAGPLPTTLACAAELLAATRAGVVQHLLSGPKLSSRLAYHFGHFSESLYAEPAVQRTIEFRQCDATLDADEVVAFARLWAGLCQRACEGPLPLTCLAIQKCSDAEDRRKQGLDVGFDVFDLLAMLGLGSEAKALQAVLLRR